MEEELCGSIRSQLHRKASYKQISGLSYSRIRCRLGQANFVSQLRLLERLAKAVPPHRHQENIITALEHHLSFCEAPCYLETTMQR